MGIISQTSLDLLHRLNDEMTHRIHQEPNFSQSMRAMVRLHLRKPWIPHYHSIAITPIKDGLKEYLGKEVFEWQGATFFFPSMKWWRSHGERSHEPDGEGCDVAMHAAYLTPEGSDAEFAYAAVLNDGTLRILVKKDFEEECRFWELATQGSMR